MPFLMYSKENVDRSNMKKLTVPLSYKQKIFYLRIGGLNGKQFFFFFSFGFKHVLSNFLPLQILSPRCYYTFGSGVVSSGDWEMSKSET